MSRDSISFADLPPELTIKILSHLLSDDFRALRHIIIACHKTDHEVLRIVAEQILNNQRIWLLDRFNQNYEEMRAKRTVDPDRHSSLLPIARRIVGKQYVRDTEVIDESDEWTFKKADFDIEKIRMCRKAYYFPDSHVEGPTDWDVDSPIRWNGSKTSGQPPNWKRLNIEVGFLPHPNPGGEAKVWKELRRVNETWQFFDGICIGMHWR